MKSQFMTRLQDTGIGDENNCLCPRVQNISSRRHQYETKTHRQLLAEMMAVGRKLRDGTEPADPPGSMWTPKGRLHGCWPSSVASLRVYTIPEAIIRLCVLNSGRRRFDSLWGFRWVGTSVTDLGHSPY